MEIILDVLPIKLFQQHSRITKQTFEINFLFAIWARLLFANDAPAAYAKFMEYMMTGQLVRVFDDTRFFFADQQFVAAHSAYVLL